MDDRLYCRLNPRGRKHCKISTKEALAERFPQYARLGLPAHKAALDGNTEALQQIFESYTEDDGVPSLDTNGATPLHLAVRNNHLETVRWLLRFTDLSPLTPAKHGETPAHVAVAQGHLDCLKMLVTAEGKENVKAALAVALDNPGFTPLHLSVVKNHNNCAKYLISELGAKAVGPVTKTGVTTAHVAASAGNVEVLKLLASKYKKLLDQDTSDGTTPAYFACQEGKVDALKFLHVKGSCSLTTPGNDGLKPIHAAAQCGHTNIVKYLVRELGNSAISAPTPDGATPLHFAASAGMIATATYLINSDVGGNLVMARDENGDTPAHDAADNGQIKVLKLLLESGADLYAVNSDGNTPYSLALSGEHPELSNFVMTYAAGLPQRGAEGSSKMTIQELSGKVDVVDFGAPVTSKAQKDKPTPAKEPQPVQPPTDKKKEKGKGKKGKEAKQGKEKAKPGKEKAKQGKEKAKQGKEKAKQSKEKEKRTSSSFLGQTNPSLQSFTQPEATPSPAPPTSPNRKGDDLDLTEEDLALFKEEPKRDDEPPVPLTSASDESEIVVHYSTELDSEDHTPTLGATTQYSTVNELDMNKQRKEKKQKRLSSKSLQGAMKPELERTGAALSEEGGFNGPELGFKPQFRSNPLQSIPGVEKLVPPTPPPTPATGTSASASTSDEYTEIDMDDEDEGEDSDVNPYDDYSGPKSPRKEPLPPPEEEERPDLMESENKKLLGDALNDLSDEETEEQDKDTEKIGEPQKLSKVWPPPGYTKEPEKPVSPETEKKGKAVGGASVLRKWPPALGDPLQEARKPEPTKPVIAGGLKKKWPPDPEPETEEPKPVNPVEQPAPVPPPAPVKAEVKEEDVKPNRFVSLKPVKREDTSQTHSQSQESKLLQIKLKKPTDRTVGVFSSPKTEVTSGADDELKKRLLKRQKAD